MKKLKLILVCLLVILLLSSVVVGSFNHRFSINLEKDKIVSHLNRRDRCDDFYFIQLTDTHIMHKLFDPLEKTKERFVTVLENILSLDKKPAFIVITGDLVEWGGAGKSGA